MLTVSEIIHTVPEVVKSEIFCDLEFCILYVQLSWTMLSKENQR